MTGSTIAISVCLFAASAPASAQSVATSPGTPMDVAPEVRARAEQMARDASKTFDGYFDGGREGSAARSRLGSEPGYAPGESGSDWLAGGDRDFRSLIDRLAKPTAPNPVADAAERERIARSQGRLATVGGRSTEAEPKSAARTSPEILPPIIASDSEASIKPATGVPERARDEATGKLAQTRGADEQGSRIVERGAAPLQSAPPETDSVMSWLNRAFRRFQDDVIGGLARSPEVSSPEVAAKAGAKNDPSSGVAEKLSDGVAGGGVGLSQEAAREKVAEDAKQADAARKAEIAQKAEADRKLVEERNARERQAAEEAKKAEAKRKAEIAQKAEVERKLVEERNARERQSAEEAKQAEAKRKAEIAQKAEVERKLVEERNARERQAAEEAKQAEAKGKAEIAQKAEADRKLAEERKAQERQAADKARLAQSERAEIARRSDIRRAVGAKADDDARRALEAAERARVDVDRLAKLHKDAEARRASLLPAAAAAGVPAGKGRPPGDISGLGLKGVQSAIDARSLADAERRVEATGRSVQAARVTEAKVRNEAETARRAAKSVDDERLVAERATSPEEIKRADGRLKAESQKAADAAKRAIAAAALQGKGNLGVASPRTPTAGPNAIIARPSLARAASPRPLARPDVFGGRAAITCKQPGRRIRPPGWYVVGSGDSLWKISAAHYGDGRRFRRIVQANRPGIANANSIERCQRLYLPK